MSFWRHRTFNVSNIPLTTLLINCYILQKKRKESEKDTHLWRRSWESHSSYSLNGAASSNGKDDFWAALQPNYNYIMDTNLIDSCREANGEIVEFLSPEESRGDSLNSCFEKVCGLSYLKFAYKKPRVIHLHFLFLCVATNLGNVTGIARV